MKSFRFQTFFRPAVMAAAVCAATAVYALDKGAAAPDFTLPSQKGTVHLADYKGRVVYLDFWASWCGPCKKSFPFMNEMAAKYAGKGLEVVAVNVDAKREDADKFLAEVPAKFTVVFDTGGKNAKQFQLKGMPSSFIIDRDGKVFEVHEGFHEEKRAELEARIASALGGK